MPSNASFQLAASIFQLSISALPNLPIARLPFRKFELSNFKPLLRGALLFGKHGQSDDERAGAMQNIFNFSNRLR